MRAAVARSTRRQRTTRGSTGEDGGKTSVESRRQEVSDAFVRARDRLNSLWSEKYRPGVPLPKPSLPSPAAPRRPAPSPPETVIETPSRTQPPGSPGSGELPGLLGSMQRLLDQSPFAGNRDPNDKTLFKFSAHGPQGQPPSDYDWLRGKTAFKLKLSSRQLIDGLARGYLEIRGATALRVLDPAAMQALGADIPDELAAMPAQRGAGMPEQGIARALAGGKMPILYSQLWGDIDRFYRAPIIHGPGIDHASDPAAIQAWIKSHPPMANPYQGNADFLALLQAINAD